MGHSTSRQPASLQAALEPLTEQLGQLPGNLQIVAAYGPHGLGVYALPALSALPSRALGLVFCVCWCLLGLVFSEV